MKTAKVKIVQQEGVEPVPVEIEVADMMGSSRGAARIDGKQEKRDETPNDSGVEA